MTPEPVELVWQRECAFQMKPCRTCQLPKANAVHGKAAREDGIGHKFSRQNYCAACGLAKDADEHFGLPPSLNVYGSGDPKQYQRLKQLMEKRVLRDLNLIDSLPRPCAAIMVECEMTFPDRIERDEGNLRGPLEKALGDALQAGGWLVGDSFYPRRRFTFGAIVPRFEEGVARTRLTLFPVMDEPPSVAEPAAPAIPGQLALDAPIAAV